MNHVYRLVWSNRHSKFVVAHEKTRSNGRASSKVSSSVASVLLSSLLIAPSAWAAPPTANTLPTGAQVTAGSAAISTSGNTMNVQQSTQRAAINWTNFSIGSNATVNFQQPNASAVMLNRVVGNEQSVINGALNANGQVFLLNSNGVLFGQGASVNVGGLVASTLNQSDADFMAGRTTFERNGSRSSVINLGNITAADGGYVALLGNQVSNQGVITARLGTAALAAGDKISLNFNGNSLVGVTIDQGTLDALIENKQAIYADGGMVVLTAKAAEAVLGSLVNNTGEIRAQTVANQEGKIYLLGDMENGTVKVDGTLDARAPNGGNGGFVETSAAHVKVADSARVTTLANSGQSGTWLIDPNDFTVAASGGDMTGAAVGTALAGGNFTIQSTQGATSGNGDIFVNDNVTWTSGNTLTLNALRNIKITSTIDASGGSGGVVNLYYGQGAVASGNTATYDFGLTSSGFAGKINLKAGQNFNTKLGSNGTVNNWTVITSLGAAADANTAPSTMTLQGMAASTSMAGKFVLGANIDATTTSGWNSGAGFSPIGWNSYFTGKFDGLGHTISNITLNSPSTDYYGLFGYANGIVISNVGLVGGSVTGLERVGALVGYWGTGTINSSYSTASVTSVSNYGHTGGLVGDFSNSGDINSSFSTGSVTSSGSSVGGLVGYISTTGNINSSYSTGTISSTNLNGKIGGLVGYAYGVNINKSYSTGNVSGVTSIGGLVGTLYSGSSLISDSYSTGNIAATGASSYAGGLAGEMYSAAVTNSYSTGLVSGQDYVGGLTGQWRFYSANNSNVSNVYSTGNISGRNYVGGLIGNSEHLQLTQSYATGNVTGTSKVGGLFGDIKANNLSADTLITQSYATGNITASGDYAGGLIGLAESQFSKLVNIQNSYSIGATSGASYVGGMIGSIARGTITNSYSADSVIGSGVNIGGLIGASSSATAVNSYWDTQTSGLSSSALGTGKTTAELKAITLFGSIASPAWDIVADNIPAGHYPQLRWATTGTSAGTSVWVIGKPEVTYTVTGGNQTYGQTFTLPTPTYTGGTPTGTSTVKVYDANNNDVTSQAVAGTLAAGTYTVKDSLVDTTYQIASSGNTDGTLVITAASSNPSSPSSPSSPSNPSTADVERQATAATHAPREIARTQIATPRESDADKTKQFTNVATVPSDVTLAFNKEDPLAVLSSPNANEPTQTVTLADAKKMLKQSASSATDGGGTGGDREVRVPVSRNSLAEIVNGGVKLPTGVEQQLFVVKAN